MRDPNKIYMHIDTRFEELNIIASATPTPREHPIPHCDCLQSNERFFGERIRSRDPSPSAAFTMVPTEATPDGLCVHCGYFAVVCPPIDLTHALANRKNAKRKIEKCVKPVLGVNQKTGERVEFPSAKDAMEAGFGSVARAIRQGRPLKGWVWTRVEKRTT